MAQRFKLVTIDFQDYATDAIGISKDAQINEAAPTCNYGIRDTVPVGQTAGGTNEYHGIIEITMPEDDDILGFGDLVSAKLRMYNAGMGGVSGWIVIGVIEIQDIWAEGDKSAAAGACNWTDRLTGAVAWALGDGAVKTRIGAIDASESVVASVMQVRDSQPSWMELDLTPILSMGDVKTFVLVPIQWDGVTHLSCALRSREYATANLRPILRLVYKDYSVEAFTEKDSALSIEPNPNNPEQPILKWGGVEDTDFVNFKLYRDTVPITTIAGLSGDGVLLATITSPEAQEYVDKTVPTDGTEDGTTFYYMVIAEDGNSTGDDATRSANVSFTKPGVATVTVSPSGASNVGATKTLTVTSGNDIKRLYADWKDGSKTWYTYEIVGTTQTAAHVYSSKFTSTTLSVRVEDELGFWSSETDTSTSISIADTTPKAVLVARPTEVVVGETVHMNASLSHPMASNEIITDYKYTYGAITTAWVIDPFFSYKTVTEGAAVAHKVRVKTQGGLEADSDVTYIAIVSDEAELLTFSRDTVITTRGEKRSTLYSTSSIQGGDAEVDVRSGLSNVSITLNGLSSKNNLNADLTLLKEAVEDYAFVKILVTDEICGTNVYYEGRIVNYSLTKTSKRVASWTAEMRVVKRDDGT